MFMKLFATSIVAKSLLGDLSSFSISPFSLEWLSWIDSNCVDEIEKKATSAPEITAEQNNKKNSKTDWIKIIEVSKLINIYYKLN